MSILVTESCGCLLARINLKKTSVVPDELGGADWSGWMKPQSALVFTTCHLEPLSGAGVGGWGRLKKSRFIQHKSSYRPEGKGGGIGAPRLDTLELKP